MPTYCSTLAPPVDQSREVHHWWHTGVWRQWLELEGCVATTQGHLWRVVETIWMWCFMRTNNDHTRNPHQPKTIASSEVKLSFLYPHVTVPSWLGREQSHHLVSGDCASIYLGLFNSWKDQAMSLAHSPRLRTVICAMQLISHTDR